jgi:hypothetical protein
VIRSRRRRLIALLAFALGVSALVLLSGPGGTLQHASGQAGEPESVAQTDASLPAHSVIMMGSSANGETWGIGEVGSESQSTWTILHYVEGQGWALAPMHAYSAPGAPVQSLSGFAPDESPLTGQVTATGAAALLGAVAEETTVGEETHKTTRQVLLTRNPGGEFQETQPVPSEGEAALLKTGESLFGANRAPLLAPLDEGNGLAGALVVPVNGNATGVAEEAVLHWDGSKWTREQIEIPGSKKEGFRVLAIGASSPENAWLLGELPAGGVALFHRHLSEEKTTWKPVSPSPGGTPGEALTVNGEPFTIAGLGQPPTVKTQILTVTSEGVWIDGERPDAHALLTMFFKPAEGQESGQVEASWCNIPVGVPAGTPPCTHTLSESLPTGRGRSFAWSASEPGQPFGRRVITGLSDGVSLRLEGESFVPVLALGSESSEGVGAALGAAFSSPREGWLGSPDLPTHLTTHPAPDQLSPYPVPFRYALLAVAPQPGVPVGELSSQALAVGEHGEVARYTPGEGWQPESLFEVGGRLATLDLRAVAWPTPTRAYAVGDLDSKGDPQMWLWRAETGLWEPDPAAPRNFRGNLLGIAFNPNNPGQGYAVGQQGVLLGYGKNWTQEALPPEVQGASFTSVAFAGDEAIVAYRIPHLQSSAPGEVHGNEYTGGLLVNSGSGWHVDPGAAGALAGAVPWAVAGLPDGGAALSAESEGGGRPIVLERNEQGGAWQPTPVPYPGVTGRSAPGSLALFRENGELRVIGSGSIPDTDQIDFVLPAPTGFPETLIKPYPAATGYVLRQTANGWSDEEHDRNEAGVPPPGNWSSYDAPYQGDPTAAVLVDPTGSTGWAVGGVVEAGEEEGRLDTADIARYREAVAAAPVAPIPASATEAMFAIGGGAECAAPCAKRANTGIGPDRWLSRALEQAQQVPGLRGFFDLGPRLTEGKTNNEKLLEEIPYARELARYAELLSGHSIPAFPVVSPTDIAGGAGECFFREGFKEFPAPLGKSGEAPGLATAGGSSEPCGGQAGYYALSSTGPAGTVRVIVLDEASGMGEAQLQWLTDELNEAAAVSEPAIVLGYADLNAQIAANDSTAVAVASVLVKRDGASAYFYESPEHNVTQPLSVGSESIPTFGTGTLGYVLGSETAKRDFTGYSGFLIAQVNAQPQARNPSTGRWPVSARLIPNVGELAMEAENGVLLHRSEVALFNGLARRPRAGCLALGGSKNCETSPYIPIPANCVGANCAEGIFPEYTFSSSRPEIGNFVKPNLASAEHNAVLLEHEETIPDPESGLFCAYNPGTTVVTISAGGLSASLTVTVQAGSVRRPCGTVPLKALAAQGQSAAAPAPPPAPAPTPAGPAPASSPPPVPVPPAPIAAVPPASRPAPAPPPPFFLPPALAAPVLAFVPPPVPTPARPTPPSGTSAVTSPVEMAEHEDEEESATESVSNQALAYSAPEHEPSPVYILGIVLLAAFAGASTVRRRPRRGRREVKVAPATISTIRAARRSPPSHKGVNRW